MSSFINLHPVWFTILCLILFGILLLAGLLYYGFSKPPTEAEKKKWLPGDDLLGPEPNRMRGSLAVTVNAPKEKVWPFLAQLGQRRGGFYSFGWLERLFTFHIYNTFTVVDEWQHMYVGEYIFYHQCGIGSEVKDVKVGEYFTSLSDSRNPSKFQGAMAFVPPLKFKYFAWSWNFILEDAGEGKTRFFTRCDAVFEPYDGIHRALVGFFLGIPSFVMCKGMLTTIKACAEGRKK
ncbi:MAG: hypothetical protein NTZ74_14480 [Chloroflexi bacterium]|nr:hypothetical protein [Chloroflexota bacterium]